jgi:putative hemolysin
MKTLITVMMVALLGACVSTSPVMSTGRNSYLVTVQSHNQWHKAIIDGVQQANSYCQSKGMLAVVNQTQQGGTEFMASSTATVQFSCFREDDPAYRASTLRPDNGVSTIEEKH